MKKTIIVFSLIIMIAGCILPIGGCAKEISMTAPEFQLICDVGIATVNLEMEKIKYEPKGKGRCIKIVDKGDRYIISGFGTYTHSTLHQFDSFKDWTVTYIKTKSTPTLGDTSGFTVTFN